jgi:hypothetical protein
MSVLLEDNMRLVDRLRTVSAKSYRKSRHIRNLLKGLKSRKKDLETSELLYVQQLVKAEQLQLDLEEEQLKTYEISSSKSRLLYDYELLKAASNAKIELNPKEIQGVTNLETTKDVSLENLSSSDYVLLAAVFGWGVVLTILAGVMWTLLT